MRLPRYTNSNANERAGINALQAYAAANSQIWREITVNDVGIDGHLEFVTPDGFATGKTIGVQVKSGPSYFKNESTNGWKFYIEEKHKAYWESYPLPVILVLHNTETNSSYWTDARQVLRTSQNPDILYIEVPRHNLLQHTKPFELFNTTGVQESAFIDNIENVLITLINTNSKNASFPLNYFDLFVSGLINIGRSLYFGMDLAIGIAEYKLSIRSPKLEVGIGLGSEEYDFLFDYVKFTVSQNLAHIDFSDCLADWDRELTPRFIAPLTNRGRELVETIHSKESFLVQKKLLSATSDNVRVAQEGILKLDPVSYLRRLPRIVQFQSAIISKASSN